MYCYQLDVFLHQGMPLCMPLQLVFINTLFSFTPCRYQRQFERYEADENATLEALKVEHEEATRKLTKDNEEAVEKLVKQLAAAESSLGDVIKRGEAGAVEAAGLRDTVRELKEAGEERVDR